MKRMIVALLTVLTCAFAASAAPAWVEYHDRNGINHTIETDKLRGQGYRMISLSTYGLPSDISYAAVWVKRPGPEWHSFANLTLAEFQARFGTEYAAGFRLALIASAGSAPGARFAGVFEKNPALSTVYPIGLADFNAENMKQKKAGRMLRSMVDFGPSASPLYIAIWEKNPTQIAWNAGYNLTPAEAQQWFNAETAQWARQSFTARTASGRYIGIYRDDSIGSWASRGEMTTAAYEAELAKFKAQGFYPTCVQAGGYSTAVRFTAIFAKSETPIARQWTATGAEVPTLAALDAVVKKHMMDTAVRAGSLAVTRNGKLVYARAYTWSEPGYPLTQPESVFRIASCSKPLTSIGIHQLIESGQLSLDTKLQDVLQTKPSAGTMDPRYTDIRIWHLLSHLGGRYHGGDLPNHFAVRDATQKPFALSKADLVSYMAGQPLDFDPGISPWKWDYYSNLGFLLLGRVIEKKRGVAYSQSMKNTLWSPLGVTRPRIARSLVEQASAGEVRYHDRNFGEPDLRVAPSVVHDDGHLVPLAYGGENYETFDSFGGWVLAAADYAKVLAAFDLADNPLFTKDETVKTMWSNPKGYEVSNPDLLRGWFAAPLKGGAVTEYMHGGGTPGVSTVILHRTDGISIVALFNGPMNWIDGDLNATLDAVPNDKWPSTDLFPKVGIPSFNKVIPLSQAKLVKPFPNGNFKVKRVPYL